MRGIAALGLAPPNCVATAEGTTPINVATTVSITLSSLCEEKALI